MQAMQAPTSDPLLDRPSTPPGVNQLQPPNHPMLSCSQRRKRPVVIARPQKPSLKDGFCGLGGHAATVAPPASQVVRSV
jgi:hypothetical protein